jgi:DNA-binding LacI/PurR family transcriptional regulator
LALGALRTLAERGVAVPDDVAVMGLDDIEDGRFSVPTLSTMAPDKAQIAERAVQMLQDRLDEGRSAPPQDIRADVALVPRESTLGRKATTSSSSTRVTCR